MMKNRNYSILFRFVEMVMFCLNLTSLFLMVLTIFDFFILKELMFNRENGGVVDGWTILMVVLLCGIIPIIFKLLGKWKLEKGIRNSTMFVIEYLFVLIILMLWWKFFSYDLGVYFLPISIFIIVFFALKVIFDLTSQLSKLFMLGIFIVFFYVVMFLFPSNSLMEKSQLSNDAIKYYAISSYVKVGAGCAELKNRFTDSLGNCENDFVILKMRVLPNILLYLKDGKASRKILYWRDFD